MRHNKKGVSTIVATIIILAIALVGIGIVMYVIIPLFEGTTENVDYTAKCLNTGVTILSATYNPDNSIVKVSLKRKAGIGNDAFDGVKLALTDASGETQSEKWKGNIEVLETKTKDIITLNEVITKVEASVYFVDDDGEEHVCLQISEKIITENTCVGAGHECVADKATCNSKQGTVKTEFSGCTSTQVCCQNLF